MNRLNIKLLLFFVIFLTTIGLLGSVSANNYVDSCDYTITSWNWLLDGTDMGNMPNVTIHNPTVAAAHPANNVKHNPKLSLKGGDIICVDASVPYRFLTWKNIKGDPNNPIIITNKGGQVQIRSLTASYGWTFTNSSNFKILGNGDANHTYGFKVTTHNNSYIKMIGKTTDFEIAYVEVAGDFPGGKSDKSGFAGIMAKSQPICSDDPNGGSTDAGNFELKNVSIHDNYIHDVGGEGLYVGYGKSQGVQLDDCSTMNYPHHVSNIKIYNNIIENVGWDGIQLKNAHHNAKIYNNIIKNYATLNIGRHDEGLFVGDGSEAEIYGNWIENGNENSNGLQINAFGNTKIYNNVVLGAGYNGLYLNNQSPSFANRDGTFEIYNNTIEGGSNSAIVAYTPQEVIIKDNIAFGHKGYFGIKKPQDGSMEGNLIEKDPTAVDFQDYMQKDIRLQSTNTTNAGIDATLNGGSFIHTYVSSLVGDNNTNSSTDTNSNNNTDNNDEEQTDTGISPFLQNKIDAAVAKMMSKLHQKYGDNNIKKATILRAIVQKLANIKKEKPHLTFLLDYLHLKFTQEINKL